MRSPSKATAAFNPEGFTMIELLAVLFVISIGFAIVSVSVGRSFDNRVLRDEAATLRNTMRFAREQAMTQRVPMHLGFNEEQRQYWVQGEGLAVSKSRTLHQGVEMEVSGEVVFFSRGDNTGGEVLLKGTGVSNYKIVVERVTGKAAIERVEAEGK